MSVLLIIGGIVQLVALFLDDLLILLLKIHRLRDNPDYSYAYAEWRTGSILQLQRLAQEGVGAGNWSGATDLVPVTIPGERLAALDLQKPEHPKLAPPAHELTPIITDNSFRKRPSARYERVPDIDHS